MAGNTKGESVTFVLAGMEEDLSELHLHNLAHLSHFILVKWRLQDLLWRQNAPFSFKRIAEVKRAVYTLLFPESHSLLSLWFGVVWFLCFGKRSHLTLVPLSYAFDSLTTIWCNWFYTEAIWGLLGPLMRAVVLQRKLLLAWMLGEV